jgi:hypothetical protein
MPSGSSEGRQAAGATACPWRGGHFGVDLPVAVEPSVRQVLRIRNRHPKIEFALLLGDGVERLRDAFDGVRDDPQSAAAIFADGFESGDTSAWSRSVE